MSNSGESPRPSPSVSVVVPTYKEAENLPLLLERLGKLREAGLQLEVLIMDDDSRDGTVELIASRAQPWVRLIVRTGNRGLSPAVIEGLKNARHEVVVVMDADLSHPPEQIPKLLEALSEGNEFAIGSRYVPGASTGEDWGWLRALNSKGATWLARPFTSVYDPMSGFFAFRRELLDRADPLNPVGYKIGLELLVKCRVQRVAEIPIHFAQRHKGNSKLTFAEQLRYVQHLRRLFIHRYPNWSYLLQFLVVGGSGVVVNLVALTILLWMKIPVKPAIAAAISVSMLFNFGLNRRFTFSYARASSLAAQLAGFVAACSIGALLNYGVTVWTLSAWPHLSPQAAPLAGIVAGTGVNYVFCRFLVFRARKPQ